MQLLAGARLIGLELGRRQRLGGCLGGRARAAWRAAGPDRRGLVLGRQVVGRALGPLARAREEQDRRARQGQEVLTERPVEQARHDQRAGPDARRGDRGPIPEGQVEAPALGTSEQQPEHSARQQQLSGLDEREWAEGADNQEDGRRPRQTLLEVEQPGGPEDT